MMIGIDISITLCPRKLLAKRASPSDPHVAETLLKTFSHLIFLRTLTPPKSPYMKILKALRKEIANACIFCALLDRWNAMVVFRSLI